MSSHLPPRMVTVAPRNPKSHLVIWPGGRLFLVFSNSNKETWSFQISKELFAAASSIWAGMLLDPITLSSQGNINLFLSGDDVKAITTLLKMAHLKFDEVPRLVTSHELLQLTLVCHKYKLTHLSHPFYHLWKRNTNLFQDSDNGCLEHYFISWVFKDFHSYSCALERLVLSVGVNPNSTLTIEDSESWKNIPEEIRGTCYLPLHR